MLFMFREGFTMKRIFAAAVVFAAIAALAPAASADKPTYATVLCQNGPAITACPPGMPSNLKPGSVRITRTQAATIAASNAAAAAAAPAAATNINGTSSSVAFRQASAESIASGQKANTSVTGRNDNSASVTNWTVSDSVAAPANNRTASSVASPRGSNNTSVTGVSSSSSSSASVASGQGGSASVVR